MFSNIDKIYNIGMGVIIFIGACGIVSSIKDGTFMKYPYRMYLTKRDIAKGELLRDMLKEVNDKK